MSEQQYLTSLEYILKFGKRKSNRTGTDTVGVFGLQHRYNLEDGFPLFTTKKVWFKGVAVELLWFLRGDTNIKYLVDNNVHIWDDDAYRMYKNINGELPKEEFLKKLGQYNSEGGYTYGDLGPVYGAQWRKWYGEEWKGDDHAEIDQIIHLIAGLKNDPSGRRHILTAWNPIQIHQMALPPCHVMSMWSVEDNKLHCHMVQRSCDMFLGVPFNVASYSLLTHMIAQVCGYGVGEFIHTMHDAHIYMSHVEAVREQIERDPRPLPELLLNKDIKNIDDFKLEDINVIGYAPYPTIKAKLEAGLTNDKS